MPELDGIRISIADIRAAGYCVAGARTWFASQGIDFKTFLKHGIAADEFLATGDGQADQVFRLKLKRAGLPDPRRQGSADG